MKSFVVKLIANEPVMVVTFIGAFVNVLMVFGVPITEEAKAVLLVPFDILLGMAARQLVTPTKKFDQEVNAEAANIAKAALDAPTWGDLEAELRNLELKARLKEIEDGHAEDGRAGQAAEVAG